MSCHLANEASASREAGRFGEMGWTLQPRHRKWLTATVLWVEATMGLPACDARDDSDTQHGAITEALNHAPPGTERATREEVRPGQDGKSDGQGSRGRRHEMDDCLRLGGTATNEPHRRDFEVTLDDVRRFAVPPTIALIKGGSARAPVTLSFGVGNAAPLTCRYTFEQRRAERWKSDEDDAGRYALDACDEDLRAGDVFAAGWLGLRVEEGGKKATKVEVVLKEEEPCEPVCDPDAIDDGDPCTRDDCDMQGMPAHPPGEDGTSCDDLDRCTDNDQCMGGMCVGAELACDSPGLCQEYGTCDPATGTCQYPASTDGSSCTDGNTCNGEEQCLSGACQPGLPPQIDDGKPCTLDLCTSEDGVTHPPVDTGFPCLDSDLCNGAEVCDGSGECLPGVPLTMDDGNPCTADSCDSLLGVIHAWLAPGTNCADSNLCNGNETCDDAGTCVVGSPLVCEDANPCNGVEGCDPASGCLPGEAPNCDDGDPCNGAEACSPGVGCVPGVPPALDDSNPCTVDSCDRVLGVQHDPEPEGTSCAPFTCDSAEGLELQTTGDVATGLMEFLRRGAPTTYFDWSSFFPEEAHSPGILTPLVGASSLTSADGTVISGSLNLGNWFDGTGFDSPSRAVADLAINGPEDFEVVFAEPIRVLAFPTVSGQGTLGREINSAGASFDVEAYSGDLLLGVHAFELPAGGPTEAWVTIGSELPFDRVVFRETGARDIADQYFGNFLGSDCFGENPCSPSLNCDSDGTCQFHDAPVCDDGNACNGLETCDAAKGCIAGIPSILDDNNVCTIDSCDPVNGATHAPVANGSDCSDSNTCNGIEECVDGICLVNIGVCDCSCSSIAPTWSEERQRCEGLSLDEAFELEVCGFQQTLLRQFRVTTGNVHVGSGECDVVDHEGHGQVVDLDGDLLQSVTESLEEFEPGVYDLAFDLAGHPERTGLVTVQFGSFEKFYEVAEDAPFVAIHEPTITLDQPSRLVFRVPLNTGNPPTAGPTLDNVRVVRTEECVTDCAPEIDDDNPCTVDECDPLLGVTHDPVPDGTVCNDGSASTMQDMCQDGICAGITSPACVPPPSGLVGWWPGDENANDIVGGNNASLGDGATFMSGQVAQGFVLDGIDDFVELGNHPTLHVSSGDFTVDAWVLFDGLEGDMSIVDKMSAHGLNFDGWRLLKQADNRFWFCFGGSTTNRCFDTVFTVFSTTRSLPGVWFHVAGVKDSTSFSIYVNGQLEDTRSPVPEFLDTNSASLRLGSYILEGSHLNGLVDEVELFNRALTRDEIRAIYEAGTAGKCKDIQANQKPAVDAGLDQSVSLPGPAVLAGTVTDDGLPTGGLLDAAWTTVSGPGTVTFADPTQASTSATYSAPGTYVLQLEASDGELTASDEVTVVVGGSLIAVPNVVGLALSPASASIETAGLRVGNVTSSVDGRVLFQLDALPSERGWAYVASEEVAGNAAEERIFGVEEGILVQDSIGLGFGSSCGNHYAKFGLLEPNAPVVVELTARVLDVEEATNHFGFAFGAEMPGAACSFGLGQGVIQDASHRNISHDTSSFHDYRAECDPVSGQYLLFVDGQLTASNVLRTDFASNVVILGDGTCGANAHVEVKRFQVEQSVVYSQNPIAETLVPPTSLVDLDFSSGPLTARVPAVSALSQEDAEGEIRDAGLQVRIVREHNSTTPQGSVIRTRPLADSHAAPEETVTVTVSKGPPECVSAPADIRAWFRAEESSRDEVSSTTATETGGVEYHPAVSGEGLFLADGYLELPHSSRLEFHGQVSLEGWVRPSASSGSIVVKSEDNGANALTNLYYLASQDGRSGRMAFLVHAEDGSSYAQVFSPPSSITPGEWVHVAGVADGTTLQLFINGVSVASSPAPPAGTNAGTLLIGASKRGTDRNFFFGGGIDELSIYGRALSRSEIASIYEADIGGKCLEEFNAAPIVDAGADQAVTFPDVALLGAITDDDGLPLGSVVTCQWSETEGVIILDPTSCETEAEFVGPGSYTLEVTASDGELTASDQVTITVTVPVNQPPVVDAGGPYQVAAGQEFEFNGSFDDDGLPPGAPITIEWGQRSPVPPPGCAIDDFTSLNPTARCDEPGTYQIILIVDDGELDGFDITDVIVGPRVNEAPRVAAGPDGAIITLPSDTVTLACTAADDGLPEGAELTFDWQQMSGPSSAEIADATSAITQVTLIEAGEYVFRCQASDSELTGGDTASITVNPDPNTAPTVMVLGDDIVDIDEEIALGANVSDDGRPVGASLTFEWRKVSGPGEVIFTPSDNIDTFAKFSAPGVYVLRLVVGDSVLEGLDDHEVTVTDAEAPTVAIVSPADSASVTAPTEVLGTVANGALDYWVLDVKGVDEAAFRPVASGGTAIDNDVLGTLDPSLLLNGQYELRLTASDLLGRTASVSNIIVVEGNLKVGNFTVSFRDLSVALAGIPLEIIRTYDSRDKGEHDFGIGWTLDIRSVRTQESRPIATEWFTTAEPTGPFGLLEYCLFPERPHLVTVTLSDGKVFKFEAATSLECQVGAPFEEAEVVFRPLPGTNAQLVAKGETTVGISASWPGDAELTLLGEGQLFDADKYELILYDGRRLDLDQTAGLEGLRDLNGNELTITEDGIFHSSGASIAFARDAQGRIVTITDPMGEALGYAYNTPGDLATFTDREGSESTYGYNANHDLTSIRDPRGVEPIRNEYDANGRLIRHTDADGNTINYTHDIGARQEIVEDRLGHLTVHAYDERGNVLATVDALGNATTFTYDGRDNQLTECNAFNECTTHTYDANDNRLTETDPLGGTTTFTFDTRGNVLTTTDALDRVTTNTYDSNGNLVETEDSLGNRTSHGYDSRGLQTSITDPLGSVATFEFDNAGNLMREIDVAGKETVYVHDANGSRLSQTTYRTTDAGTEALVTAFDYDAEGRLVRTTQPDGATTSTEYNELAQPAANIDALGHRTEQLYDDLGRVVETRYPGGTTEKTEYDAEGRRVSSTDRAGRTTQFIYDAVGRLTDTVFPDGTQTTTVYDATGRTIMTADETGAVTRYEYDAAGRRIRVIDPLGNAINTAYDEVGNQIATTDAAGHSTEFEYDALNRQVSILHLDGTSDASEYDPLGRRAAKIDQAGVRTEYGYDPAGRLVNVTDALGGFTQYEYDEQGNQTVQVDASGRTTLFAHDPAGRRVRRTLPLGAFETMAYDMAGNLTAKTDFIGRTIAFAYDLNNRLITKTFPDSSTYSFGYTPTGQRASATDSRGTTTYAYDVRDRLTALTYPDGRSLSYTYDAAGRRASMTAEVGGSRLTALTDYDFAGHLTRVEDPNGGVYTYEYDLDNLRTVLTQPNDTRTTYTYDPLHHLISLATVHTPTSNTIQSYAYTLGPTGIRTRIDEADGTVRAYEYDDLYRLTGEAVTGSTTDYMKVFAYDAVGNRLSQTTTGFGAATVAYTYDERDRLLTENGVPYAWDENGNQLSKVGDSNYTWDYEDHLIRVDLADGTVVQHTYDFDGVRVRSVSTKPGGSPEVKYFLVDASGSLSHVVTETDDIGEVAAYYVRGGAQLLAVIRRSDARYCHIDALGSTRLLTDASGTATDMYSYAAFGENLTLSGDDQQPYRFAGEEMDGESDQYLRARWYGQDAGRFRTADPAPPFRHEPQSLNRYLYAHANPVTNKDPLGLFTLPEVSVITSIQGVLRSTAAIRAFSFAGRVHRILTIVDLTQNISDLVGQVQDLMNAEKGTADISFKPLLTLQRGRSKLNAKFKFAQLGTRSAGFESIELETEDKGQTFGLTYNLQTGLFGGNAGIDRLPTTAIPLIPGVGVFFRVKGNSNGLFATNGPTFSLKLTAVLQVDFCPGCTQLLQRLPGVTTPPGAPLTARYFELWSQDLPDGLEETLSTLGETLF